MSPGCQGLRERPYVATLFIVAISSFPCFGEQPFIEGRDILVLVIMERCRVSLILQREFDQDEYD